MADAGSSQLEHDRLVQKPAAVAASDFVDPVIEAYKKDIDRTMLRENLKLTPNQRSRKFERAMRLVYELRRAARKRRAERRSNP